MKYLSEDHAPKNKQKWSSVKGFIYMEIIMDGKDLKNHSWMFHCRNNDDKSVCTLEPICYVGLQDTEKEVFQMMMMMK